MALFMQKGAGTMEDKNQRHDYESRIKRLEDNDEKIFASLEKIRDGQHNQDLVNQKMNFTLDAINREREIENQNKKRKPKEYKRIKDVGAWFNRCDRHITYRCRSTHVLWYLREVMTMFKFVFGASFWPCFWFGKCK